MSKAQVIEPLFSPPATQATRIQDGYEESYQAGNFGIPPAEVLILGTRGVPARHGGFETFAEQLSVYLKKRGWNPSVYCQEPRKDQNRAIKWESWSGVRRILVPSRDSGSVASMIYDLRCVIDAARRPGTILLLGYNTAVFVIILRLLGRKIIINMDGLEWKRAKWSRPVKIWFWLNERIATYLGHTLIADHPEIRNHLSKIARPSKLVMIPYGAPLVSDAPMAPLEKMGLAAKQFFVSIARVEPENSQLEVVRAFSATPRGRSLLVLGKLDESNAYHRAVRQAASDEVIFPGPIYEKNILASLRFHAAGYCHGHTVGGTNPSLVEALGAGCPVIAHDNPFNRWTAGPSQFFFKDMGACQRVFDYVCANPDALEIARQAAFQQHKRRFELDHVLGQYERLLGFDWQHYVEGSLSFSAFSLTSQLAAFRNDTTTSS